MIASFKDKGLEELFLKGSTKLLPKPYHGKIAKVLAIIHAAEDIKDLSIPALRLHKLKKPPYKGFWSLDISGNYRIIFKFDSKEATDLKYIDTH